MSRPMSIVEVNKVFKGKMFAQPNLTLRRTQKGHHEPLLLKRFSWATLAFKRDESPPSTFSEIG